MTHLFVFVYWDQFYDDEHFASFFPDKFNKTRHVFVKQEVRKLRSNQSSEPFRMSLFTSSFLANTLTTSRLESTLITFSLILRSLGRPGLLQFHHLFLHLPAHAGLHLAGDPWDQEQDFLRDLPDVLQKKPSGNQSGLRWRVVEWKQGEPGRWGEGHGLLKRN